MREYREHLKTGRPLNMPAPLANPAPNGNGSIPQPVEEEEHLPEAQLSAEAQAQMQAVSEAMNALTGRS